MSETETPGTELVPTTETPAAEARPWHGTLNPFEAMYQHFMAEIAALRSEFGAAKPVTETTTKESAEHSDAS